MQRMSPSLLPPLSAQLCAAAVLCMSATARAQAPSAESEAPAAEIVTDPAPEPQPVAPAEAEATPPPASPEVTEPAPATMAMVSEPAPAPAEAASASPAEGEGYEEVFEEPVALVAPAPPEALPLKLSSFMHLSNRIQNFNDPKKLNRFSQENVLYLIATGEVYDKISYQAAIVGAYGPTGPDSGSINGSVALLDVIAKLDLDDAFHIWAGRMLVPSDRSNFSGFWFMAPWYYPGGYYNAVSADNHFFGAPVGPRQGPAGRNDGATLWGELAGGLFKYYVGAYDLFSAGNNPLVSGRLNLALINPEPGYFHSSTYYGKKDILALGASAQYQKSKGGAQDYSELSADLLFEKNTHGGGTIDLEAAFYKYYASAMDLSYFLVLSYLTPEKVGPGFLQPLIRLQRAKPVDQDSWTIFEAQLGYIVSDDAARLALGYQWQSAGGVKSNALYLGLQLQK